MDKKQGDTIVEHIRVYCRQRPKIITDEYEADEDWEANKESNNDNLSRITLASEDGSCSYYSSNAKREFRFKFDGFLNVNVSQEEVYEKVARPIVQSAIEGYSGTIFAYGPTGSGKTHTMRGEGFREKRGLMPRCVEHLLMAAATAELWVSYLQIYREDIEDLLSPSALGSATASDVNEVNSISPRLQAQQPASLSIREHYGRVFVEGLSRTKITSVDEFMEVLRKGDINRTTAATHVNLTSSRSHAAILISICTPEQSDDGVKSSAGKGQAVSTLGAGKKFMKESTLVLVDLAGSERAGASEGMRLRLEEAKAINLSLSALGNCMNALAEGRAHVPYRDSKLTRLLQGSLGGGSRTAIIATLPAGEDSAAGDTLSALRFASRATCVKVEAKVSRFVDYEALYQETLTKLDASEKRERDLQRTIADLRSTLEAKELRIELMRDEINKSEALVGNSANKSDSKDDSDAEGTRPVEPAFMTGIGSLKSEREKELEQKLAQASATYHQEMIQLRGAYEKKMKVTKKAIEDAVNEATQLELDLQAERSSHLSSMQQLNALRVRLHESEQQRDARVQELLVEINDLRVKAEDNQRAGGSGEVVDERIAVLSNRLAEAEAQLEGSVSRTQVLEMERLFSETVSRLAERVQQLEHGKRGSRSTVSLNDDIPSADDVPAVAASGAARGVRFDVGRLRPVNGVTSTETAQKRFSGPVVNQVGAPNKVRGRY